MITGLDLNQTIDFILKGDKENPTIWKLGVIPSYLFARISGEAKTQQIEMAYKILQVSIKGWENFSVPYSTEKVELYGRELDVVPLALLEQIPMTAISELSIKAMEINEITDNERKN